MNYFPQADSSSAIFKVSWRCGHPRLHLGPSSAKQEAEKDCRFTTRNVLFWKSSWSPCFAWCNKRGENTSSEHFLQTQSNQTISQFLQAYHLATFVSLHLLMPPVVGAQLGALTSISLQGMEIEYSFLSGIISPLCFLLPRTSVLVLWGSQRGWGSWWLDCLWSKVFFRPTAAFPTVELPWDAGPPSH